MRAIYSIVNLVNQKRYIGKAENLSHRLSRHAHELKNNIHPNKHLQSAYNLYGKENFAIDVLDTLEEDDDINEREKSWIEFYHTYDQQYGYNKTKGGDGGNSYFELLSDEAKQQYREKTSKRMSGQSNHLYGKHMYTNGETIIYISDDQVKEFELNGWHKGVSEYTREKERKANLGNKNGFYGKKHSEETRKHLSETRSGSNNWNYGKHIYHKGNKQKYISEDEIALYVINGWEPGLPDHVKKSISEKNKGKTKTKLCQNATKYMYQNQIFYGWRKLREYLRAFGYPKISETAITKLSKGLKVKGYDDLFQKITIV